jgi:hypothetical protein
MARKDLAGLAALGALGYILNNQDETKVQDRTGSSIPSTGMSEATRLLTPDNSSGKDFGGSSGTGDYAPGPSSMMRREPVTKPRPRPVTSQTTTARPVTSQAAPSQSAPAPVSARTMSRDEAMAELDRATGTGRMDPNATRGPNAVTGTDFGRNVSNTLSALTPIGGGVGKVGVDMAYRGRNAATAAEKFREAATVRKAAEGYSPAEALSVLQKGAGKNIKSVGREEVTNPMMWAAGPKNAKNFKETARDLNKRGTMEEAALEGGMKRGGKVKKMASGGMARSSASSRADGIASRGKTRGKVC